MKRHQLIISGLLAVSTLGLSACGKDAQKAADQINQTATTLELNSNWKSNCESTGVLSFLVPNQTEEYDFGSSFQKKTTLYRENNCQTPAIQIIENGNKNVGSKVANADAFELNEHIDSVSIVALNDDGQKALNAAQACGINDWAVGQARDVTAKTTDHPVIDRCWTKSPRDIFDIVNVSGSQLKLGLVQNGQDKTTAAARPTALDQSTIFTRQ